MRTDLITTNFLCRVFSVCVVVMFCQVIYCDKARSRLHHSSSNRHHPIGSTNGVIQVSEMKRIKNPSRNALRVGEDLDNMLPLLMDTKDICKRSRRLRGKEGFKLGAPLPERLVKLERMVTNGVRLATNECQYQFRNRRWNCTTVRRSLRKVLLSDIRETSFINAMVAAGITFAITRACTRGDLNECSCEKTGKVNAKRGLRFSPTNTHLKTQPVTKSPKTGDTTHNDGEWEWGGCGDNIYFGNKKSRECLDARHRKRKDIKTLTKLHNHEAGRLAIKNHMITECKCHGLSGSCTLRTCWRKMPSFREVGNRLKERFDGAAKVKAHNNGLTFIPEGVNIKPPVKGDLVYTEDSPDFCQLNRKTGSLGTQGRQCVHGSQGVDGCELLCCGRGFTSREIKETTNCKCRFKWCCEVTCDICHVTKKLHTCN